MSEVRIAAEPRTEFGKGGARRTRRAGKVPAVLYGHGEAPRHLSLPARELARALKSDAGFNVLLRLEIEGGGSELALPKALQRDPIKGSLEHLDLLLVRQGETITTDVPVHTTGNVAADGILNVEQATVSVTAEATHIPDAFEVDLGSVAVGESVTAGQLDLPQGVELTGDPDAVVLNVLAQPSTEAVAADLASSAAELDAGGAGTSEDGAGSDTDAGAGRGDIVPSSDDSAGGPSLSPADAGGTSGNAAS